MYGQINELFDLEDIFQLRWSDNLNGKKPPKKYIENYVSCKGDFSSAPRLVDFVLHGLSYQEAVLMRKLLYIEQLKQSYELKKMQMIYTSQELAEFENSISERIRDYNESA